jgi:hypothetical protein
MIDRANGAEAALGLDKIELVDTIGTLQHILAGTRTQIPHSLALGLKMRDDFEDSVEAHVG